MSYILDALRKSDQQRRRGAAPALLPAQAEAAAPKRLAPLIYAALALILLGAGIAIGWLRPWPSAPAGSAMLAAAVKPSEAPPPQQPVIVSSAQPALQGQSAPPAVATPAAAAAALAPAPVPQDQEEEVRRPRRGAVPRPMAAPKGPVPPGPMSGTSAAAPPQTSTIVAMKDLPVAIQQELPPMSISVHAYSRIVAERLVGINNRLLHEGDEVAPGLTLEQITPDGMVLGFKAYRFRRGVH